MRFLVRLTAFVIGGGAALVAVGAALLAARLATGPLAIDAFAPQLEARINARLDGWRVDLDGVDLVYDRSDGDIGLQLREVSLRDPAGSLVASAPSATVKASLGSALRGRAALTEVQLIGVALVLTRAADGAYRFALENAPPGRSPASEEDPPLDEAAAAAAVAQIVEGLAGDRNALPMLEKFRRVRIVDTHLRYEDRMSGATLFSDDAALSIRRTADGLLVELTATAAEIASADASAPGAHASAPGADAPASGADAAPPFSVALTGMRTRNGEVATLSAEFEDVAGRLIAAQIPALEMARDFQGALSGSAEAEVRLSDGDLLALSAKVSSGPARVAISPGVEPLALEEASVALGYDPGEDRFALERLRLRAGGISGDAEGYLRLERNPAGEAVAAAGSIVLRDVSVERRELYDAVTEFPLLSADLAIGTGPLSLSLRNVRIEKEELTITGAFDATIDAEGRSRGGLDARISAFDAARLPALWPKLASADARAWVAENVFGGEIEEAVVSVDWGADALAAAAPGPGPDPAVDLTFRFRDLATHYVKPMSPIEGGAGSGRVTTERFEIELEAGSVSVGEAGVIDVSGSRFVIPDLTVDIERGDVSVKAEGPARAVLALIDQEPMGFPSKFGLAVSTVRGEADVEAEVSLPLLKDLPLEDVEVSVGADLRGLALQAPKIDRPIAARAARIEADKTRLTFSSRSLVLDGVPLRAQWTEAFSPTSRQDRTRIELTASLDADRLNAFGAPEDLALAGAAALRGTLAVRDGAAPRFSGALDATDLAVTLPSLRQRKPTGAAGEIGFQATLGSREIALREVDLVLGAVSAAGAVRFSADGDLIRADLARVAVGPDTALSGTVEAADGGYRVRLSGPRLDLRPYLEALDDPAAGGGAEGETPLDLKLDVQRARLDESRAIRDLAATLTRAGGSTAVSASAETAGGAPISLDYRERAAGGRLEITSDDAGLLLRDLKVSDSAGGGTFDFGMTIPDQGPMVGRLIVRDVTLRDPPILASILSNGLILGLIDGGGPEGIRFSRVRAPFRVVGPKIFIQEAAATGPSMGITADGEIDRRANTLSLTGSVSPLYAINSLLGRVPVIGDLLTGGRGQGVVGVAYSVSGSLDDPDVVVNPLSALAPGALRELFEGEVDPDRVSPSKRERFDQSP
ncbi:MAG: AsmA-like C-terminal domain-containing protein [Pseudomonadota bacterium]